MTKEMVAKTVYIVYIRLRKSTISHFVIFKKLHIRINCNCHANQSCSSKETKNIKDSIVILSHENLAQRTDINRSLSISFLLSFRFIISFHPLSDIKITRGKINTIYRK